VPIELSAHHSFTATVRVKPPGSRKVVVLANDGFRPRAAAKVRKAELVCRAYDANDGFWTLDQYEIRYIVKATGRLPGWCDVQDLVGTGERVW
jgi:hypothetical protein